MSQTNEIANHGVAQLVGRFHQFPNHHSLPDVAQFGPATPGGTLDRVGMSDIETAIRLVSDGGDTVLTPALAQAFVSLEADDVKGIHMSRLFLTLQNGLAQTPLTPTTMNRCLESFVASHAEVSDRAFVGASFQHLGHQESLLSGKTGWRHYPVQIESELSGSTVKNWLHVRVTYSSTCPCSAALSRQVIEQKFQSDFAYHRWLSVSQVLEWIQEHGSMATPHAQRSFADVCIELAPGLDAFPISPLIDAVEQAVQTPVQSVVKRIDEQEFARLNGQNLMFCEDAVRRIKSAIEPMSEQVDFRIESSHLESLHPHNAVAVATRGIPNGLRP